MVYRRDLDGGCQTMIGIKFTVFNFGNCLLVPGEFQCDYKIYTVIIW